LGLLFGILLILIDTLPDPFPVESEIDVPVVSSFVDAYSNRLLSMELRDCGLRAILRGRCDGRPSLNPALSSHNSRFQFIGERCILRSTNDAVDPKYRAAPLVAAEQEVWYGRRKRE
jgi:hypothetical protein